MRLALRSGGSCRPLSRVTTVLVLVSILIASRSLNITSMQNANYAASESTADGVAQIIAEVKVRS